MSDLKPETRALLELGRLADDPSDEAVEQNRRTLALRLGAAALSTAAVSSATSKAAGAALGSFASAKGWVIACGALVVAGTATFAAVRSAKAPATLDTTDGAPAARAAEMTIVTEKPVAPKATLAGDHDDKQTTSAATPAVTPQPSPPRPSSSRSTTRSIQEEVELLRSAQQRLHRGEGRAALKVLAEHGRRFPSGILSEEREASRVFALCQSGDVAAARRHAERFIRSAPNSPFVARVQASCGAGTP